MVQDVFVAPPRRLIYVLIPYHINVATQFHNGTSAATQLRHLWPSPKSLLSAIASVATSVSPRAKVRTNEKFLNLVAYEVVASVIQQLDHRYSNQAKVKVLLPRQYFPQTLIQQALISLIVWIYRAQLTAMETRMPRWMSFKTTSKKTSLLGSSSYGQ